jgi:hypothetical protein
MKTYLSLLLLAMLSLSIISPSRIRQWSYTGNEIKPIKISSLPALLPETAPIDLNHDNTTETLISQDNQAWLSQGQNVLWSSPSEWEIAQTSIADLNQDGELEIALLLWRPFKPWPIDRVIPYGGRIKEYQDSSGYSCHLILIGWKQGEFREVWAGSALARPIHSFTTGDLDQDGYPELLAIEGQYNQKRDEIGTTLSIWMWNGFGFDLLARHKGRFTQVAIRYNLDNKPVIWTQD